MVLLKDQEETQFAYGGLASHPDIHSTNGGGTCDRALQCLHGKLMVSAYAYAMPML